MLQVAVAAAPSTATPAADSSCARLPRTLAPQQSHLSKGDARSARKKRSSTGNSMSSEATKNASAGGEPPIAKPDADKASGDSAAPAAAPQKNIEEKRKSESGNNTSNGRGARRESRGGGGGASSGNWRQQSSNNEENYGGRQRRRTSTRGEAGAEVAGGGGGDGKGKAAGAAAAGGSKGRLNSQSAGKNKKEWSDRKSFSQQDNNKREKTHSTAETDAQRRTRSTTSGGKQKRDAKLSMRTTSQTSNGDGFDYDNYDDLEEPFSDSDAEDTRRSRGPQKMLLAIPRGRIRTLSGTVPVVGYSPKWGGPTMCLSCLHFFDLPEQLDDFAEHLLMEHHIVVVEMGLIVDPKRYIEHWRQRFAKESIDNIFPRIEPAEGDQYHGKVEYYFEMSEHLPEDYSLRQRLAMRRLEEALSCQQREREDGNFSLQCIFCRYTARGNRSKIIHHLYMIHHLNLGSPDNLVFVTEYIEHLKEKLGRNECIYCEKIFADRNTLMDHMRKRNHREVNPKNHYYDKFYIINYLELGKRWLEVLAEDFEDTITTFVDSDEEEEEDSWCEWQEDNVDADETRVVCLACDDSAEGASQLMDHMKNKHEFDLLGEIEKEKLGMYERMKLVNFIRRQNYNSTCWVCGKTELGNWLCLYKHIDENHKPIKGLPERSTWDTEAELVPLFGNDHLLWMLESLMDERAATPTLKEAKGGLARLVAESKNNTVEGVVAEDLPNMPDLPDLDQMILEQNQPTSGDTL